MSLSSNFDPDELCVEAINMTGLDNFGHWNFKPAFYRLSMALETEANLNQPGRVMFRQRLLDILCTRLRFEAYLGRYPEIMEEDIGQPLVIVGLPRTGTTVLQRMLAVDDRFYSTAYWESRFPVPVDISKADHSKQSTRSIQQAKLEIQHMLENVPELAAIHPLEAEAADEESLLLEQTFYSTNPESMARLTSFGAWLEKQDHTESYLYLKRLLQFLQWQKTGIPLRRFHH